MYALDGSRRSKGSPVGRGVRRGVGRCGRRCAAARPRLLRRRSGRSRHERGDDVVRPVRGSPGHGRRSAVHPLGTRRPVGLGRARHRVDPRGADFGVGHASSAAVRGSFVLATANPDKAREISAILGSSVSLVPRPGSVPDVEETGSTLEENARLKAVALVQATGMAAGGGDTRLEGVALGGAPGVYSARYAGADATYADNVAALLSALSGVADRRARFRTVALAVFPDGREVGASGSISGVIAPVARGTAGFGYDPLFVP